MIWTFLPLGVDMVMRCRPYPLISPDISPPLLYPSPLSSLPSPSPTISLPHPSSTHHHVTYLRIPHLRRGILMIKARCHLATKISSLVRCYRNTTAGILGTENSGFMLMLLSHTAEKWKRHRVGPSRENAFVMQGSESHVVELRE